MKVGVPPPQCHVPGVQGYKVGPFRVGVVPKRIPRTIFHLQRVKVAEHRRRIERPLEHTWFVLSARAVGQIKASGYPMPVACGSIRVVRDDFDLDLASTCEARDAYL